MSKKNDLAELEIQSVSSDGSGVGRLDGMAVFVPGAVAGDRLRVRLVKVMPTYAYAIAEEVLSPSPDRCAPGCGAYPRCGGCSLRSMTYAAELRAKQGWVADALRRIGGFELQPNAILPSPQTEGYRNKAQYPIGSEGGRSFVGFYAPRSHRIIPADACPLQPEVFGEICRSVCRYIDAAGAPVYDEETGTGLFRHIYLRQGEATGEIMVCLVVNGKTIPSPELLLEKLAAFPQVASVLYNINTERTNVILGGKDVLLRGRESISDTLCGIRVEISPRSFYQVNRRAAEVLYGEARRLCGLTGSETLLDLYCGAGAIGLSMADAVSRVIGVEIVPEAIADAKKNAERNGIRNARFIAADAGEAAERLASEGLRPDIVVVDPPRKGCDQRTLEAVLAMAPQKIVMVSCNPATAARDLRFLADRGYALREAAPVDLFPRTSHVETVVLMSRVEGK